LEFVSIVVSICAASALKARRAVPTGAGILSNDACVFFAAVPDITEAGQIATYALQPIHEHSGISAIRASIGSAGAVVDGRDALFARRDAERFVPQTDLSHALYLGDTGDFPKLKRENAWLLAQKGLGDRPRMYEIRGVSHFDAGQTSLPDLVPETLDLGGLMESFIDMLDRWVNKGSRRCRPVLMSLRSLAASATARATTRPSRCRRSPARSASDLCSRLPMEFRAEVSKKPRLQRSTAQILSHSTATGGSST
jgi:hypothetical protein